MVDLVKAPVSGEEGVRTVDRSVVDNKHGASRRTTCVYLVFASPVDLDFFFVIVTGPLENLMKALALLLRQTFGHTNKQNLKYTFREFLGSLKLIHRSCRDVFITDKTPVLGLDTGTCM